MKKSERVESTPDGDPAASVEIPTEVSRVEPKGIDQAVEFARSLGRPVRLKEFMAAGIHQQLVMLQVRRGVLKRVGRGCYALATTAERRWSHLATVSVRHPGVVVCGPTACAFHGLVETDGGETWLAIRRGKSRPPPLGPDKPVRVREWLPPRMEEGVTTRTVDGVSVRVVTAPYAVAELAEIASTVGETLFETAIGNYMNSSRDERALFRALEGRCGSRWRKLPGAGLILPNRSVA